ncbi:hypothetical protein JRQ81_019616, partial [Phrynocephalus forsythii]
LQKVGWAVFLFLCACKTFHTQTPFPLGHSQDQHSVIGQNVGPNPGGSACPNPNAGSSAPSSSSQWENCVHWKQMYSTVQYRIRADVQDDLTQASHPTIHALHLTRPPPDYKDQRRNQVNIQQSHQYSGGPSAASISSTLCFPNTIPTPSLSPQASNLLSTAHGTRMASLPAGHPMSCYGNVPCSQPSTYNATSSGMSPVPQNRNPKPIIAGQNNPTVSRQAPPGQGNNLPTFDSGQGINPQPGKPTLNQGTSTQRPPNMMVASNSAAQSWGSQETGAKQQESQKVVGSPFTSRWFLCQPAVAAHCPPPAVSPTCHGGS